jgi:spore coat protein CotF
MNSGNIKLTASEMASLWDAYINNTHNVCVLKYFVSVAEDAQVADVLHKTLEIVQREVQKNKQIIQSENIPVPLGFGDQDVDINAPRLFSDTFSLMYVKSLSRVMLTSCALMYTMSARSDIRSHFKDSINQATIVFDAVSDTMLTKGIYTRPPFIEPPKKVDFIEDKDYFRGSNFLKDQRYLNAVEITHIFGNIEANVIGNTLTKAFGQTADLKKVREFMNEAGELSEKVINSCSQFLTGSNLPSPMGAETQVFSSTKSPFSDRLMMYELSLLTAAGVTDYATSLATSMRNDLRSHYMNLFSDTLKLANKAEGIMIANSWIEQPPQQDKIVT